MEKPISEMNAIRPGVVTCPASGRPTGRTWTEAFVVARPIRGFRVLLWFSRRRSLNALGHFPLPSTLSNSAHRDPSQTDKSQNFFRIYFRGLYRFAGGNKWTEEFGHGGEEFMVFMNDSIFLMLD